METSEGWDEALWKQMSELGWMGIAIPEEFGGAGYSFMELSVLLEEMGRFLLPAPFFSSVVLAAETILNAGTEEQKKELLPGIADGTTRATLGVTEPTGSWDLDAITTKATRSGTGYVLEGAKMYVLDGNSATLLIVAAATDAGLSLFVVDPDAEGIIRTPLMTLDMTRKQAKIDFSGTPARLLGEEGAASVALARTLDQATVALATEMVGGAQWCLDTATEHAKSRIQFGRPIGSFQAVKHKCAEMLIELEMAKSAAYYASWVAAEDEDEMPIASCLAKAYCSDAFFSIAAQTIQVLGGIGFTWEHDAHLYLRRAKSSEIYLGDSDYHRELLARRTGVGGEA